MSLRVVLHEIPYIFTIDNFLSNQECDKLIEEGNSLLKDSTVVNTNTGKSEKMQDVRTSKDCWFYVDNPLTISFQDKLQKELGVSKKRFESLTMLRYDVGGYYIPHCDYFEKIVPSYKEIVKNVGNRIGTAITYLNDVEEGGNTKFPKLDLTIKPKKGMMLYFQYDYENRKTNAKTIHTGEPVLKGHKYIVTTWIREFDYTL